MKILCTCPPMIASLNRYRDYMADRGMTVEASSAVQSLTEEQLIQTVGSYDGWIIGDDPVTFEVLAAGRHGRLKAAVRWGVGTDNVDYKAANTFGYNIPNTPGMFNEEVSDVAIGYLIGLARGLFAIDRGVRNGGWPKPVGMSLKGKTVALIGYGNIGKATARKLLALGTSVIVFDPQSVSVGEEGVEFAVWPDKLEQASAIVLTAALSTTSQHIINADALAKVTPGILLVNVGRGGLVDEAALVTALSSGIVGAAALDVFEVEPLVASSPLRSFENCVFGSHNGSNTLEAVDRTSIRAIDLLKELMDQLNS